MTIGLSRACPLKRILRLYMTPWFTTVPREAQLKYAHPSARSATAIGQKLSTVQAMGSLLSSAANRAGNAHLSVTRLLRSSSRRGSNSGRHTFGLLIVLFALAGIRLDWWQMA